MDLAGKRVTVMGLGRFGGGIGVTRWLAGRGADVLVTDLEPATELTSSIEKIQDLIDRGSVTLRLGEHNVSDFTTSDLVVANPAVPRPWENRFLRAAEAAGKPITTEMTLLIDHLPPALRERTVGITGSVGKSTTTAMIHHALGAAVGQDAGRAGERVALGGNIGGSLLPELETFDERTWLVLEISSAMLYWLERTLERTWSPRVGVFTNLSPNHIDWHGDLEHYTRCKLALFSHQRPQDFAVLGENVWSFAGRSKGRTIRIDPAQFTGELKVPGAHNRVNAAAALAACRALCPDAKPETLAAALASFPGLAHRLQLAYEHRPRGGGATLRFYNDSKSTTPESALKAIEAVASMPGVSRRQVHLIAGGYDKGSDLTPVAEAGAELGGLYTIGATGPKIAAIAGEIGGEARLAYDCGTLENAVTRAVGRMAPGDVLLLSPGCASWDQFTNFEERGELFIQLVKGAIA